MQDSVSRLSWRGRLELGAHASVGSGIIGVVSAVAVGPDPSGVRSLEALVAELDRLRRHAARGSGRARVPLDEIARRTGIPRSTVHSYVSGSRTPTPDALDQIVVALGVRGPALGAWATALDRALARRPVVAPRVVPRQLPARPVGFRGRVAELAELQRVADPARNEPDASAVIALTGTGGVGKTATALQWAHGHADLFPDGQIWIDLHGFSEAPAVSAADALEYLLRSLGVNTAELPADVDARAAQFRTAAAGRRMVLILDNARDSAQVRPLLPGTSGVLTIITSRDRLPALVVGDGAVRIPIDPLPVAEAVSLLAGDAPPVATEAVMERIAERCEGLPLTLRILRERLATVTAAEVERFASLLDGAGALDAFEVPDASGELSVRAALRWSYEVLPEDVARTFRHLPLCLVPTIDVRCLAVVLDVDTRTARRLLELLFSASLVDRIGVDTYRVHDLVLAFAREVLRGAPDDAADHAARERLLRYLCAVGDLAASKTDVSRPVRLEPVGGVPTVDADLVPAEPEVWLIASIELVNAAAIDAIAHDLVEDACTLVERGWRALRWTADLGLIAEALDAVRHAASDAGLVIAEATLTRLAGVSAALQGRLDDAAQHFEASAALSRASGDPRLEVLDRVNLAHVWMTRGELDRAIDELEALAARSDIPAVDRVPLHNGLVEGELQRGRVTAARSWLRVMDGLRSGTVEGALGLEVDLLSARVSVAGGELSEASSLLDAIETEARQSSNRELLTEALTLRTLVLCDVGQVGDALEAANEAAGIAKQVASRRTRVNVVMALARAHLRLGDAAAARSLADEALGRAVAAGIRFEEATTRALSAEVFRSQSHPEKAREEAEQALILSDLCGYAPLAARMSELLDSLNATSDG